jgi:hypothetical protein
MSRLKALLFLDTAVLAVSPYKLGNEMSCTHAFG